LKTVLILLLWFMCYIKPAAFLPVFQCKWFFRWWWLWCDNISSLLRYCLLLCSRVDLDYLENVRSMIPINAQRRSDLYYVNAILEPSTALW